MMSCPLRLPGAALLCAALLAAACSDRPLGVYRIDVQQGNVLSEEMLARLSPGMEKRKVRFVLGTPMLIDTFNQDRWDYIFTYSRGGGRTEQRQITLFFEDDRLVRIEGDVYRGDGYRESTRGETLVLVPEEPGSKGWFDALRPGFDLFRSDRVGASGGSASPAPGEAAESAEEGTGAETLEARETAPSEAGTVQGARGAGAPGAVEPGTEEEDPEGWFNTFLQYLKPRPPASRTEDPGPPSSPGTVEGRQ